MHEEVEHIFASTVGIGDQNRTGEGWRRRENSYTRDREATVALAGNTL